MRYPSLLPMRWRVTTTRWLGRQPAVRRCCAQYAQGWKNIRSIAMIDFFEFQLRPRVLFKAGLVDDIGPEIAYLGAQRALIVADEGTARAGLLDRVRAGLQGSIEIAGIFTEVPPNSSVAAVTRGADYARECGADLIVAVGGGSPIDTAKAIRILLTEDGRLED